LPLLKFQPSCVPNDTA